MSKIAHYLNEHILGEISSSKVTRQRFSRDASVLSVTPELVMFPRVTNDIRKAARFSWQLAEKGHVLPITTRGGGSSTTGAAIGKGLIINTTAHLNNILHINLKDKDRTIHVQPGVNFKALNDALNWHRLYVPTFPETAAYSTVGGAVANNSGGQFSGQYGLTGDFVKRLEVVLANGDLIETTRLKKHEFNKKKGLQTFEGEIYRKIDGIIEDNQSLIAAQFAGDDRDNAGYGGIAQVKDKDGSFDLTPLFIGSQGTLGIISEIVICSEYISKDQTILVAVMDSVEAAHDAADALKSLVPSSLETIDGEYFEIAKKEGKHYAFDNLKDSPIASVLYLQFSDFAEGARNRKLKKAFKILDKFNTNIVTTDEHSIEELTAIREVSSSVYSSMIDGASMPPLIDGSTVPSDRHEDFFAAVGELETKHHISLPLHVRVLDNTIFTRPLLHLDKLADKQKVFKLVAEYAQVVHKYGGTFISDGGEGRLKANAAYATLDEDLRRVYEQVRVTFDPFGTLNPGVKQSSDLKDLVGMLRSSYDTTDFAQYSPHS